MTGKAKIEAGHNIPFDPKDSNIEPIMTDLHNSLEHDVQEIGSKDFNNMVLRYAKDEQKSVIYLMYKEEHVNLAFKAASKHPIFYACVFFSFYNPPSSQFQGLSEEILPSLGFIGALNPDFTEGNVSPVNINGNQSYFQAIQFVADKLDRKLTLDELMDEKLMQTKADEVAAQKKAEFEKYKSKMAKKAKKKNKKKNKKIKDLKMEL